MCFILSLLEMFPLRCFRAEVKPREVFYPYGVLYVQYSTKIQAFTAECNHLFCETKSCMTLSISQCKW